MRMEIDLTLNGRRERREVSAWRTLLEAVRDDFGLKGTKGYCYIGVCGACTVLVDGNPVSSCVMLVAQVNGKEVTTVEGLEHDGELHPIQQAFVDNSGLQCGYCTPGMLLMTKALLEEIADPTPEQIAAYIGGNICRCTGYGGILQSVKAAADAMSAAKV